jgi:hypothetical protein
MTLRRVGTALDERLFLQGNWPETADSIVTNKTIHLLQIELNFPKYCISVLQLSVLNAYVHMYLFLSTGIS